MGYETRMHVVSEYDFIDDVVRTGQELASIDLCKCGDGPVGKLIAKKTKEDFYVGERRTKPFALYPRRPDRQQEAVDFIREAAKTAEFSEDINKLANDIEDGYITEDCYGDKLGVIEIDEMIEALKAEKEGYRRFEWALALLETIKRTMPDENLKIITFGY